MRNFKGLKTVRTGTHWATTATMWWNAEKVYNLTVDELVLTAPESFYGLYFNKTSPDINAINMLMKFLELKQDNYPANYNDPGYISSDYFSRILNLYGEIWVNTIKVISNKNTYVPVILLQILYTPAATKVVILNPVTGLKETVLFSAFAQEAGSFHSLYPYKVYGWNKITIASQPLRDKLYISWWDGYKPVSAQKLIAGNAELTGTTVFANWKNNLVNYFGGTQKIFTKPRTMLDLSLKSGNSFYVRNKTLQRPATMIHDILLHETTGWSFLNLPTAAGPYYPHFCVQPDGNTVQYFDMHEYHHHVEGLAATSVGIDCSSNPWSYHADSNFKVTPMYYSKTGTVTELQNLIRNNYNFSNAPAFDYIFAPPVAQLESLALLIRRLMTLLNIPVNENSWAAFMNIDRVVQLAKLSGQYADLTDSAIAQKITGKANSLQTKVFLIRRVPEYFLFDSTTPGLRKSVKPTIYGHGFLPRSANTDNHSDGNVQAVYLWLRIVKNYSKDVAYTKMQELFNTKRYDLTLKGHDIKIYALDVTTI